MFSNSAEHLKLTSFFTPENILIVDKTQTFEEAIRELLNNLALTYGIGNIKKLYEDHCKKRGSLTPKRINDDAFIEHFRISTTEKLRIAWLVNKKGVALKWHNDVLLPKIIILIVSPVLRPDLYLNVFSALSTLLITDDYSKDIISLPDSGKVWEMVDLKGLYLPSWVTAEEILEKPAVIITEEKNLEDAIDLFVKTGLLFIPVIDKDGELLGEVTLQELMNVCLPRHILWMDDIGPVLNFESFRNMIQNESNTWLNEIMVHNIARVEKDDPAIKAGIEMKKNETDHAYVMEGQKLVGVITLQQFISKVLRE